MLNVPENSILIKGDLSGIQEFIFNIPSKGAAKNLKGRSYYVQMISLLAEHHLLKALRGSVSIYNGGGNFYLYAPANYISEINNKQEYFTKELTDKGIFLVLSYIKYDYEKNYSENLTMLNKQAQVNSLNKFQNINNFDVFNQIPTKSVDDKYYKDIAEWLVKSAAGELVETKKGRGIAAFDFAFNFTNSGPFKLGQDSNAHVLKWNEVLIKRNTELDVKAKIIPVYEAGEKPTEGTIIPFEWGGPV